MNSDIFIGAVTERAFIEQDGKVLMVRHPQGTKYGLPGGRLNKGESPTLGVLREAKEELGVDIVVGSPLTVAEQTYDDGTPHYIVIFYAQFTDPSKPLVLDPTEVGEVRWVSADDIGSLPLYPDCEKALKIHFKK
ncbi:MAG TPA: NUDIX hydrolase [Candidatus Paceibacterota bacterium]|jgi:8-oxo-dGTP diphosphatase|nr:NUDIX hydrolase [Candidatus Paceibacterota bacterium]